MSEVFVGVCVAAASRLLIETYDAKRMDPKIGEHGEEAEVLVQ